MNKNVIMSYVDAQSYVTNYRREIKDKPEFEQISNYKILEWSNKSLKRKGSLLSCWGNLKKTNKDMTESNFSQNSRSLVIVSASHVSGIVECSVKFLLMCYFKRNRANFFHVFNRSQKKKSCHVVVKTDSNTVLFSTNIDKREKFLN